MKKFASLVMALAMAMCLLSGCGGKTTEQNAGPVTANPNYPNNGTINCVIGWSAGGTTDLIARKVASEVGVATGANNNCTNVTGASGSIAAAQVVANGQDGETAWGGMISAINTWRAMDYNDYSWKDFYCFISAQTDYVLCVGKGSQFTTYQEFIDYASANPDKLTSGNPGLGSVGHLAAVTMCNTFGISTQHVPYAGGRAAAIGVMGGEIEYVFIAYGDVADLIKSGDLVALGCTGNEKTINTTGGASYTVPSFDEEHPEIAETINKLAMWGVALPRTAPAEQVLAFEKAWKAAVTSESYLKYCEEIGVTPVAICGEEADQTMAAGEAAYVEILEQQKLTAKSAADLGIASSADYSWDKVDTSDVIAWPTEG